MNLEDKIFQTYHAVNDLLTNFNEPQARSELIKLLSVMQKEKIEYSELTNSLIRQCGLLPYMKAESCSPLDRVVYDAFKTDVGLSNEMTLHREQSSLLKQLLDGKNIAISAPTSFGKSFVIDAFISITRPTNVVIIVPTISLTDETRRRIHQKFSSEYKVITTTDCELSEKNIFIFPQERANSYLGKIKEIDILIIDEFYKASVKYDKERSPSLIKAILKFSKISKQKYFLAPNIKHFSSTILQEDIEFIERLDFNTVYLDVIELYKEIDGDLEKKTNALVSILQKDLTKTLIYVASYSQIDNVTTIVLDNFEKLEFELLENLAKWLETNYSPLWSLPKLVRRGFGIHNGQLHRSLSQIQVKVFDEQAGLRGLISTSSLIEGVNTSAENIVLWKNRKGGPGNPYLDSFMYKNIIGRGGRMFKHFIGNIYLLESPPTEDEPQLEIEFPDEVISDIDENDHFESLSDDQIKKIHEYKAEIDSYLGSSGDYDSIVKEGGFANSRSELVKKIAYEIANNPEKWNGLSYLNSDDPKQWERFIRQATYLDPGKWGVGPHGQQHEKFVQFVMVMVNNWVTPVKDLIKEFDDIDISPNEFFSLERKIAFNLSSLFSDINTIQKKILKKGYDIGSFINKLSSAFLPKLVYELEEYGLPRMIARKIQNAGLINFEEENMSLHQTIAIFQEITLENVLIIDNLDEMDKYILRYFYEGITPINQKAL
jgi:hypothetical protein